MIIYHSSLMIFRAACLRPKVANKKQPDKILTRNEQAEIKDIGEREQQGIQKYFNIIIAWWYMLACSETSFWILFEINLGFFYFLVKFRLTFWSIAAYSCIVLWLVFMFCFHKAFFFLQYLTRNAKNNTQISAICRNVIKKIFILETKIVLFRRLLNCCGIFLGWSLAMIQNNINKTKRTLKI